MKPVEFFLRGEEWGKGRMIEGVNPPKIYFLKHM
jgi:hypothetical protein